MKKRNIELHGKPIQQPVLVNFRTVNGINYAEVKTETGESVFRARARRRYMSPVESPVSDFIDFEDFIANALGN